MPSKFAALPMKCFSFSTLPIVQGNAAGDNSDLYAICSADMKVLLKQVSPSGAITLTIHLYIFYISIVLAINMHLSASNKIDITVLLCYNIQPDLNIFSVGKKLRWS
jgi:hypothetical protein